MAKEYRVFKYPCPIADEFRLELPVFAKILSFQMQRETPCIWTLVNPENKTEIREFRIFGTGHPIPEDVVLDFEYVGTAQMAGGTLVWHLFRKK